MTPRRETSAQEALILITCACAGPGRVRDFMKRVRIQPSREASAAEAILAHYRTRSGYDLRRFAHDFRDVLPSEEMAA